MEVSMQLVFFFCPEENNSWLSYTEAEAVNDSLLIWLTPKKISTDQKQLTKVRV